MSEPQGIVRAYRESHHRIAELVALGYTPQKIRQELGVSQRRLTLLLQDPTFRELIAHKEEVIEEKVEKQIDLYAQTAVENMIQAEFAVQDAITEHLDDPDGQRLSVTVLNKIAMDRADRFGYGKNSTLKVEHGIGDALDRAIARSGKVLEGEVIRSLPASGPMVPVPKLETVEPKRAPVPPAVKSQGAGRVSLSEALRRRRVA